MTLPRRFISAAIAVAVASAPALVHAQQGKPAPPKPAPPASPTQKPKPLSQTLTGGPKADFEAAKLLAGDGDFAGALIKFQSAYDVAKDPRLLWNIAFCHKNLRHYAKVVALLQRYVDEGAALLLPQDKKDAQDLISTIEPFTTKVTIQVNEAGAEVFVDEEQVGVSPLPGPVVLDIGQRHLRVQKAGFVKFESDLVVGGSAEATKKVDLAREVHEGKVIIEAPAAASISVDEKPVGTGKAELTLPAGGHQLRVTAPGMRPYQSEMLIEEKETRQINITLEAVAAPEKPKLRVSVGCADSDPRGPTDGLIVYTDGMEVLAPGPVKSRLNPDSGKNVVEYVEYPIDAGKHQIRVVSKGCQPLDQAVDVDQISGALVSGSLPSSKPLMFRGPQGSPGTWRLGVGAWFPGSAELPQGNGPDSYREDFGSLVGVVLDAGIVSRWFATYLNLSYAKGTFQRTSFFSSSSLPNSANASWDQFSIRFGPRFPFNVVSLGIQASLGGQQLDIDQVRTGKPDFVAGAYGELDVQPTCDWGAFLLGGAQIASQENSKAFALLQIGAFWEPNSQCRVEQSTPIGLSSKNQPEGPPAPPGR
jgi:hypothetical protein